MRGKSNQLADSLTFSQRYGYSPLPEPMRLEELSTDVRRELWNKVRRLLLGKTFVVGYNRLFRSEHIEFVERVIGKVLAVEEERVETEFEASNQIFRRIVTEGKFYTTMDLIECISNYDVEHKQFAESVRDIFDHFSAAYFFDSSCRPYRFYPKSSKEQGEATQHALNVLHGNKRSGSIAHLQQATAHINLGQYADSIAHSIRAVESVARLVDPNAAKTLGPALESLEQHGLLNHSALKEAFKKLYGYTSDEQGIRHALLEKGVADVGLDEAVFMFGACASFAAYLVNKSMQTDEGAPDGA